MGYRYGGRQLKALLFLSFFAIAMICAAPFSSGQEKLRFSPYLKAESSAETGGSEFQGKGKAEPAARDSLLSAHTAPVNPTTAMYHSLAVSGWGQLDNGKKKKAALFFIAETVCIGGVVFISHKINSGDYQGIEKNNLVTDRNTFILYWMIAKIFGIMDAYVDAHLANYDISDITPEDLKKE